MLDAIGIDLGTTNSLCAVFRDGLPELIPNAHGSFLTPSVVGILKSGEIVVGETARQLRITDPERTASCFKRFMGTDRQLEIAGQKFSAHQLSAIVLRSLVEDAERHLGRRIEEVVITVPAYFNDYQRQATKLAGELAGLHVRRIINEPTAAALVYGFHERDAEKQLCMIDLGGGTFDVTIMDVFEGTLEIRATAGECMLGGEDFTDRLVSAVLQREGMQLELAELKQPLRVARIRAECELAKREMSREPIVTIRLPNEDGHFPEQPKKLKVDRANFDKLCKELMRRIAVPIDRALRDAGATAADIDEVILVGGATRMPTLRQYVENYFSKPPLMRHHPDQVVALGAAIQAALISQDAAVDDMVMTDVCPFTLGVEIVKEFGGQIRTGYFHPVLHRNSTIPISREEIFHTVMPNQPLVEVRVFQGDARRVDDNVELGKLVVENLPARPAGMPIHIRFTYDINGLLEVEAYTPGAGKKHRAILTNHVRGLTPEQIDAAAKRMQELKFYPQEDLENQRLARYCERMLGELNPYQRQQLDQALDIFEGAMLGGDKQHFEQAREGLLMVLSSLGLPYSESEVDDNEY